jgi:hypothetical protein
MNLNPPTQEAPTWFLIFLIEQLGGSLVLDGREIENIQERSKDKIIKWWNDSLGRFLIEVTDDPAQEVPSPIRYKPGGPVR